MNHINVLLTTAATVAFIHTFIGIDHYVPFIALNKANNWAMKKTLLIVTACGLAHVLSSVALGVAGIALSKGLGLMINIENFRGSIATYFLIAFGLVYTIYGIRRVVKNKTHSHVDEDGQTIMHVHTKNGKGHDHNIDHSRRHKNLVWGLVVVFLLGPCEPLIPIVMYPAAAHNTPAIFMVTAVFAVCTIGTMLVMTSLGVKGISMLRLGKLQRYTHVLAGSAITLCGLLILVLPI